MRQLLLFLFILLICSSCYNTSFAARVDTLDVYSAAMQKTLKVAVVLPEGYKKSKKPLPVLYLLRGGQGSFSDWLTKTIDPMLLHKMEEQYNYIFVYHKGSFIIFYINILFATH